ncbi:LamG-like jellyroll fold domain-containing protein [Catellatospora sp. NPDC049609]|uniref:LamG-like jellyroll fold domain-containing protein n=1 Tax=Catellatospora sp. NPDC049609 TaxID=3155505 RepID=UPI003442E0A3
MPVVAVPAAPAAAGPACTDTAPSPTAAATAAALCQTPVEDVSARTETRRIFANPDGTGTVEEFAHPQRVRRADGAWAALDATLVANPDGTLSPRASTVEMTLSGGGAGSLVKARRGSGAATLSWQGTLPAPSVDGAKATYAEVLPGVDLVVTAQDTGFSEVLVVKDRTAARNPALRKFAFDAAVSGDDLHVGKPMMWDANGRHAPMGMARQSGRIELTPDATLLTDPTATFPMHLDPTIGYSAWTMINSTATTQEYWSYDKNDCPTDPSTGNEYSTECAKVGNIYPDSNTMDYRSMFRFPTSGFKGKQIVAAKLTIDLLWSAATANSTTELRAVGAFSSATNWSNHASTWSGSNTATVSNANWGGARKLTEFSGSLATALQTVANGTATETNWGLKAADETSDSGWKKFDAKTAKLVVTTNTVPVAPSQLTVDGKACVTGDDRPFVKTSTPALRAGVQDGDGNSLTASFHWARIRYDDVSYAPSSTVSQSSVPSGTTALVNLPAGVLEGSDTMVGTGDWDNDGFPDVLAVDGVGDLYLLPGSSGGARTARTQIGHGFSGYTIAGMADWNDDGKQDFLARENATGILWEYPGNGTRTGHGTRVQRGTGWNPYAIAGLADWDRDGDQDIIARDGAGVMWLYPSGSSSAKVQLGSGWSTSGVTYAGSIDWDKDTKPDLIIYDAAGLMWIYPGSGARSPYGTRVQIGGGWTGYQTLVSRDVNGDGNPDIVAKQPNTSVWVAYPGTGTRAVPGTRWTIATTGVSDGTRYAFRATASDANATSSASGWCEFEIDTTKPAMPTVTADVYREGTDVCAGGPCGSVGKTGRFTFASSSDTQMFKWGWSNPPGTEITPGTLGGSVSVDWTPTSGGPRTMYVTAIDRAGNEETKAYQFVVKAESPAVARWKLNDPAESVTVADDSGNGRTATVNGATLGQPGRVLGGETVATFDGVDDSISRADFLDTSKSFSGAIWARLDAKGSANRSLVAQKGANHPAFNVMWDRSLDRWSVQLASNDNTADPLPTWKSAVSTAAPQLGLWTHLAWSFDSASLELRLYVDGVLQDTETGARAFNPSNPIRIGDGGANAWSGAASDLQLWDRVVFQAEIDKLVDPTILTSGSLVGKWDFEEVGFGPSYDASGYFHDLDFYGGTQVPPAGAGHTGTGLRLDGVDDYVATAGQVLHTDQSFTVSVWARPSSLTAAYQVFLAQQSDGTYPGFLLYWSTDSGGQWKFRMNASATDNTQNTYATAAAPNPTTAYHHLVGVVDAQKREMRLYVDGTLAMTSPLHAGWVPWDSTGPLLIGRGHTVNGDPNNWYAGDVDEVRLYQGVVTDLTKIS